MIDLNDGLAVKRASQANRMRRKRWKRGPAIAREDGGPPPSAGIPQALASPWSLEGRFAREISERIKQKQALTLPALAGRGPPSPARGRGGREGKGREGKGSGQSGY